MMRGCSDAKNRYTHQTRRGWPVREHLPMTVAVNVKVRKPVVEDGRHIFDLIRDVGTLDLNSSYSYLMLCKFFSDTCRVAVSDECIVGFISAFIRPDEPNTVFVWQVAVHPQYRKQRIGSTLIKSLLESESCTGCKYLEATVTPDNLSSDSLFRGIARALHCDCDVTPCFSSDNFPGSTHQPEHLYHIGPIR